MTDVQIDRTPAPETTKEEATTLALPLSPEQAKVADANRAIVLETITNLDKSTRGATKAIFAVLRSCKSVADADRVFMRLEQDWREANADEKGEQPPVPGSWRTMKSAQLKKFKALPELIQKATAAHGRVMDRNSILDKAERDRLTALLFLDSPEKLQPLAFGPDGHAQWSAALSKLSAVVSKDEKEAGKAKTKSAGVPAIIPEYDTTGMAPEIVQARQRFLRAVKQANGEVPHQELRAMIEQAAIALEKRTATAIEKRRKLEGAAKPDNNKATAAA